MNKIQEINQIIKNKRKEKKITQLDFSKMINKSLGTVKRYDTGDVIPENTLILICDKLNLDIDFLLEEQEKQNELTGKNFYSDLINKSKNNKIEKVSSLSEQIKVTVTTTQLNIIYTAFNNLSYVLGVPPVIETTFKNDKYYITESPNSKEERKRLKELKNINNPKLIKLLISENVLDILTQQQADNLIKDLQEFFEFKVERIRKEKLNK